MYVHILWTAKNLSEARLISNKFVEMQWVACANIFPKIESIYLWKGKTEHAEEVKVLFKTIDRYFDRINDFICREGSYEVPEVAQILISTANSSYEKWIEDVLNP